MKKIFLLTIVFLGFISVQAQIQISPEKKKVIAEIVLATKAEQQSEQVMRAMFAQMQAGYPAMVKQVLAQDKTLTPARRKTLEAQLNERNEQVTGKLYDRFLEKINFKEYTEQAVYPLYDKFFTESELQDLLAFYKSPTGQKLNQTLPQMTTESIRLAQEILVPKVTTIITELVQEDIKATSPK